MMWASCGCTASAPRSNSASAFVSIPSCSSSTACTRAPRSRSDSSVRSYVGRSTITSSPGPTSCSNRNASACIEPFVTSTRSGSTPCRSAIHARQTGVAHRGAVCGRAPGSLSNARIAASRRPSTSTMSSEGAPRANEIVGPTCLSGTAAKFRRPSSSPYSWVSSWAVCSSRSRKRSSSAAWGELASGACGGGGVPPGVAAAGASAVVVPSGQVATMIL